MTQWGLDTLFNPAKRHMDEEKQRLQSTREEVGDNSGGKRIDLESGRVTISRNADEDGTEEDTDTDTDTDTSVDGSAKTGSAAAGSDAQPELTPAQQRARDRRRRTAKK